LILDPQQHLVSLTLSLLVAVVAAQTVVAGVVLVDTAQVLAVKVLEAARLLKHR
jgi:hypothetical protein